MTDGTHKNIFTALAAAQSEMGTAIKGSVNPAFKSKYADLADVVQAVSPALSKNGIAFTHYTTMAEGALNMMVTALVHGESDTRVECAIPLLLGRQDMQSYKSATTYAKRIGLESVTGLAPEDDDGNAAAKSPPRKPEPAGGAPERHVEPPHDPQTGEVLSDTESQPASFSAWRDGVLDELGIKPEYDERGRMMKLPPAEAELFAKAYAASLVGKIATYKREQALNLFLSVHERGIGSLPQEWQTDVYAAAAETRDRINGKHMPPGRPWDSA